MLVLQNRERKGGESSTFLESRASEPRAIVYRTNIGTLSVKDNRHAVLGKLPSAVHMGFSERIELDLRYHVEVNWLVNVLKKKKM